jgi:2-oxoglutarate ferredoxin oxidoreductase subunit gamma
MTMLEEIIIAGFGGQGVMSMGQLLAYAGMFEDKHVSWLPSYGPEQRGGTANCAVVISHDLIGSPLVSSPSTVMVLNNPSFEKFEPMLKSGGLLIVDTSLVTKDTTRDDITIIKINATEIAIELGNKRIANMILIGAFLEKTKILGMESIMESLQKVLALEKHHLLEVNHKALLKGTVLIQQQVGFTG